MEDCTPNFSSSPEQRTVPQAVVLEYRMDRTVATADDPPVVLARMPADFVDRMGPRLKPGKLLRFAIEEAGIQVRRRRSLRFDPPEEDLEALPRPSHGQGCLRRVHGVHKERSAQCRACVPRACAEHRSRARHDLQCKHCAGQRRRRCTSCVGQIEDGVPVGAALKFDGAVHQRRGRADVWSKIAFQYQARRQPLTIAQLLAACAIG